MKISTPPGKNEAHALTAAKFQTISISTQGTNSGRETVPLTWLCDRLAPGTISTPRVVKPQLRYGFCSCHYLKTGIPIRNPPMRWVDVLVHVNHDNHENHVLLVLQLGFSFCADFCFAWKLPRLPVLLVFSACVLLFSSCFFLLLFLPLSLSFIPFPCSPLLFSSPPTFFVAPPST